MLPKECGSTDLANLLGTTTQNINLLAKRGVVKRTSPTKFNLSESVRGYVAYKEDLIASRSGSGSYSDAKTKKAIADAKLAELAFAEKTGELVMTDHVKSVLGQFLAASRQAVLSWPSRLAPRLSRLKEPEEVRSYLTREVHALLEAWQQALERMGRDLIRQSRRNGSNGHSAEDQPPAA